MSWSEVVDICWRLNCALHNVLMVPILADGEPTSQRTA